MNVSSCTVEYDDGRPKTNSAHGFPYLCQHVLFGVMNTMCGIIIRKTSCNNFSKPLSQSDNMLLQQQSVQMEEILLNNK